MATPQALAHYLPQGEEARRAVDDVNARRAAMRKAIQRLVSFEIAAAVAGRKRIAADLFDAQMAVEQLIGEMR